ncbi:MAG: hypothetical protein KAJ56_05375, partial [Candidatus Aenigmarchaeota archaeon]|nr:hypothetical protein [Candidatus Aenigmarchaeota archaeon]
KTTGTTKRFITIKANIRDIWSEFFRTDSTKKVKKMSYIVKSKIRELAKSLNVSISGEADDVLSAAVEEIIKKAAKRAEANGRKTVKARDI